MSIRVEIKGDKDFFKKELARVQALSDKHLDLISSETEKRLQFHVMASIQRPESTGNLAKQMFREKITNGWGIGNISNLNEKAPQWCLRGDTEVYVKHDDKIVPMQLRDVFELKDKIAEILTPWGLKQIINIVKTDPEDRRVIKIANYTDIFASGNHRFPIKLNESIIEKKVSEFPKKSIGCYSILYTSLQSLNKEKIINSVALEGFDVELDNNLGFVLGFILGDGHVKNDSVTITQKYLDTGELLNEVSYFCNKFKYKPILRIEKNEYGFIWRITINKRFIVRILKYFLYDTKTEKRLNNFFLNTPTEFREGILSGYKYSDGRKGMVTGDHIRSISPYIISQMTLIASSLGYDISHIKVQKQSEGKIKAKFPLFGATYYYTSRFHYRDRIFKFLNVEKINLPITKRNERGHIVLESYKVIPFHARPKKLNNVEFSTDKLDYYDLCVEDKMFLINGGLVSHNSWIDKGVAGTGRRVPPGTNENPRIRGSFTPGQTKPDGGNFRGGRFQRGGGFAMNPTKPIEPHNFIAKTIMQLPFIVNAVLKRFK